MRGRGSLSNAAGRFETVEHVAVDDGWPEESEPLPVLRTQVREEESASALSYNRSPDLPFDRSINPYRGCEHGCTYCFARPSHAYWGHSAGLDFETKLIARINIAQVLRKELRKPGYVPRPIVLGANTDGYQAIEAQYELSRAVVLLLAECCHPLAIVTKGSLILRDLEVLSGMAGQGLLRVGISITTLDPRLSRSMEPRAPAPAQRLKMMRALSSAGIPVRAMISPLVPGLTDTELEAIAEAARDAGATSASFIPLRLPREVAPLFREWLESHHPARAGRVMARVREMHGGRDYDPAFGKRMRGEGTYADLLHSRFQLACRRLGLAHKLAPLRCDLFRAPGDGVQMELFG